MAMTRISPGIYRDSKGKTVKSTTGIIPKAPVKKPVAAPGTPANQALPIDVPTTPEAPVTPETPLTVAPQAPVVTVPTVDTPSTTPVTPSGEQTEVPTDNTGLVPQQPVTPGFSMGGQPDFQSYLNQRQKQMDFEVQRRKAKGMRTGGFRHQLDSVDRWLKGLGR